MQSDQAETIAAQALAWMTAQDGLTDVFLSASGLDPAMVNRMAGEPEFLAAVLDFLLSADQHVTGFCTAQGLTPETLLAARTRLPGGDLPHWT